MVRGRVQGVGYRAWTNRVATGLGLRGWVRNRLDGSVEALFCGLAGAVELMLENCESGPVLAGVDGVHIAEENAPVPEETGFHVLQTK
nr:acylphosphatase [Phaeovibrio sulfidiphilus]